MRDLITTKTPTSYDFLAFYYSGLGKQREGLLDGSIEQYLQGLSWPLLETYGKQRLTLSLARTYFIKSNMDKTKKILDTLTLQITSPNINPNTASTRLPARSVNHQIGAVVIHPIFKNAVIIPQIPQKQKTRPIQP